jgi:hypothetical protein
MNTGIILIWLWMLIFPRKANTFRFLNSKPLWWALGGVYLSLLIGYGSKLDWIAMANPTYAGIAKLFAVPEVAAIAWIHLLIFDLLAGRLILMHAARKNRVIRPFLVVTVMAGPLGVALYFLYDYLLDYRNPGKYNIL